MQQPMIRRQPSRQSRRNVEAIFARQQARQRLDHTTFAPGFTHGDFEFDEIYQLDLSSWFEQCVFVNSLVSVSGRVLGYAVARIQEGFVTIEHHLVDDRGVARAWLAARTQDARTLVELQTTTYAGDNNLNTQVQVNDAAQGYIPMRCDMTHLLNMEHAHLRVTRDHSTHTSLHALDPCALTSMLQNNVLSLMGLCCRLLLNSSQNEDDMLEF